MLVGALLLLFIAVLMVAVGVLGGNDPAGLTLGPVDLDTSSSVVFFLGMVTLLLFAASLLLFRAAGRRAAARRRDRKKVTELSEKLEQYKRDQKDEQPPRGE